MSLPLLEQVVAGRTPSLVTLTVEQYHQMIARGILREGDPSELIDGLLVLKDRSDRGGNPMSQGPRHALTLKRLQRQLRPVEDLECHLHVQLPVTLSAVREPEPDLSVVRGREEDYSLHHPRPADVLAVMEVSGSTLEYDRTTKQRLFAAANLTPYWIVNLPEEQIEVYEEPIPAEGRYGRRTDYQRGQVVPLTIQGVTLEIAVAQVLPPAAAADQ
jgi:Uma2 family endonuclease